MSTLAMTRKCLALYLGRVALALFFSVPVFLAIGAMCGILIGAVLTCALFVAELFLDPARDRIVGAGWTHAVQAAGMRHAALRTTTAIALSLPAIGVLVFHFERVVTMWGAPLSDPRQAVWWFRSIIGYFVLNLFVHIVRLWWFIPGKAPSNA